MSVEIYIHTFYIFNEIDHIELLKYIQLHLYLNCEHIITLFSPYFTN